MITRNIINHLGQIIGTMDFPDGTSEEVIAAKLAVYATPPVPAALPSVTPRQIRQALVLSGVPMAMIESAIASLPEPHKSLAQIEWEYSTLFIRSNPLVNQIGAVVGWNSDQLDNLWKMAASL